MTSTANLIVEIIAELEQSVSNAPEGAFTLPLRDLMWVPIMHETTVKPSQSIKHALLHHVKNFTSVLDQSGESSKITPVTINKYLKILEKESDSKYTKRTWNNLFELISAAPLKGGRTMSQFWWRFCIDFFTEIICMLSDRASPFQSAAEPFWRVEGVSNGIMVNLSTLGFLGSYMGMLKNLGPKLSQKDNKAFRASRFLGEIKTSIGYAAGCNDQLIASLN
jgi:hypothetical protein